MLGPGSGAYFFLPQMWSVRPSPGGVFQEPTRLLPSLKVRPVSVRLLILSEMLLRMPIVPLSNSDSCHPYPPSLDPNRSLVDGPPKALAAALRLLPRSSRFPVSREANLLVPRVRGLLG